MTLIQIVDKLWEIQKKLDVCCTAIGNSEVFPEGRNVYDFMLDAYTEYAHVLHELSEYQRKE